MIPIQRLLASLACTFILSPAWPGTNSGIPYNVKDSIPHNGYRVMQVSFVPNFGTNGLAGDSIVNDISLNILAGSVYEVNIFEIGSLFNVVQRNIGGCELAGIGNFVGGNVHGFQCAGIINTANGLVGLQTAGLVNRANYANGLQIAGLVNQSSGGPVKQISGLMNISGQSSSFQVAGLINNSPSTVFQMAGLINNSSGTGSFQAAGLMNNSKKVSGFQVAGLLNSAFTVKGLQLAGVVNNSDTVNGSQISGVINRASYVKGVQVGVINIADSVGGVPVGVINIVKNGYHQFELSVDELFIENMAFRSGLKQFYSIVTAGVEITHLMQPRWTYGAGFGTSAAIGRKTTFNIDALFQNIANLVQVQIVRVGRCIVGMQIGRAHV